MVKKIVPGELVYGVHPVTELLKQKKRKVLDIFVLNPEPKAWVHIRDFLPKYPVRVHRMNRDALSKKLGTTDHQGIGAIAQPFAYRKKFFDPKKEPFLVLLDGVQDVRNFGAILRSAYCTGVQGVIVAKKQAAPLTGPALKASAGLAERMDIYQASSTAAALQELQNAGYTIYVAALSKKQNAFNQVYTFPACLVIGSEGTGVTPATLKAGTIVTLPQKSADVSYNASVAAGILLAVMQWGNKN